MKKIAIALMIGLASASFQIVSIDDAMARNYPCSKKKGGVVGCTKDGKFICKNGTLSASKQKCTR